MEQKKSAYTDDRKHQQHDSQKMLHIDTSLSIKKYSKVHYRKVLSIRSYKNIPKENMQPLETRTGIFMDQVTYCISKAIENFVYFQVIEKH